MVWEGSIVKWLIMSKYSNSNINNSALYMRIIRTIVSVLHTGHIDGWLFNKLLRASNTVRYYTYLHFNCMWPAPIYKFYCCLWASLETSCLRFCAPHGFSTRTPRLLIFYTLYKMSFFNFSLGGWLQLNESPPDEFN